MVSRSDSLLSEIGIDEERWAVSRLRGLGPDQRELYSSILRRFATGRPPAALTSFRAPDAALRGLVERDLIAVDADGTIAVAYPFSARPTRHRVRLPDGRSY